MSANQDILGELDSIPLPGVRPLATSPPKPTIKKISYTHDAMIDLMIARPMISGNELAAIFGYTAAWISTVRCSDSFKARYAQRRAEIVGPELVQSVEAHFHGVLHRSMEVLAEKLSKSPDEVSDSTCLRAVELSSRALGYGASQPPQVNVQVNVDQHLEKMGDNLTKLLQRRKEQAAGGTLPVPMEDEGDE